MAKFQFRYEKILKLKSQIEDKKKQEFSQLQLKIQAENSKLSQLKEDLEIRYENLRQKMSGQLQLTEITRFYNEIASISNQIQGQEIFLKELHHHEHLKRQELVEAMKNRKTYEAIRKTQWEKHQAEQKKQEQKFLDYIGLTAKQREQAI